MEEICVAIPEPSGVIAANCDVHQAKTRASAPKHIPLPSVGQLLHKVQHALIASKSKHWQGYCTFLEWCLACLPRIRTRLCNPRWLQDCGIFLTQVHGAPLLTIAIDCKLPCEIRRSDCQSSSRTPFSRSCCKSQQGADHLSMTVRDAETVATSNHCSGPCETHAKSCCLPRRQTSCRHSYQLQLAHPVRRVEHYVYIDANATECLYR
mmetsp:Transcript_78206/g.143084  ORF Transcript_78206/g.143084 Transcript_78206/m.143084 type:complete len:208 (+) Transcript_78206:743-1366(+)